MIERLQVQILVGVVGEFSSPESTLCVNSYLVSVPPPPPLRKWHVKKPRWQVTPNQAYTFDPSKSEWADYATVQAECGNLSGNELTCNLSGNTQSQLSQLAGPLWTGPGLQGGVGLRRLIPI